jgi:hypothetical protein
VVAVTPMVFGPFSLGSHLGSWRRSRWGLKGVGSEQVFGLGRIEGCGALACGDGVLALANLGAPANHVLAVEDGRGTRLVERAALAGDGGLRSADTALASELRLWAGRTEGVDAAEEATDLGAEGEQRRPTG